jgi:hypothetical protein
VFAGALREEVFSLAPVIRRIQEEFVPVAVSVPLTFGKTDPESRLYRSLTVQAVPPTSGKPVPQGICVATAGGKAIEWAQIFRDEGAVQRFLDRTLAAFRAEPRGAAAPDAHPSPVECPAAPPPERGSLAAAVVGRALDASGRPVADMFAQRQYMQEDFAVPRESVEELARHVRGAAPGARVRFPDSIVHLLLREVYLGQKDVALLGNPLGAQARIRKAEIVAVAPAAGGLWPLEGSLDLSCERGPNFHHEQKLDLEGVLEVDPAGIAGLVLVGRGTYRLEWNGFRDESARFRQLMAGRTVSVGGGVRYGILARRNDQGVDRPGSPGQDPVVATQAMLEELKSQGHDVAAHQAELERLKPEWDAIHRTGHPDPVRVHGFTSRMQALHGSIQRLAAMGRDGRPDASPVAEMEAAVARLRAGGRDVAALEAELPGLRVAWTAIQKEKREVEGAGASPAAAARLHERIEEFRPRAERFAHRIHELAAAP